MPTHQYFNAEMPDNILEQAPPTQIEEAPPTSEASSPSQMAYQMTPPTHLAPPTRMAPPTFYSNDPNYPNIPIMAISDNYDERIDEPTIYVYPENGAELQEEQNYSNPTETYYDLHSGNSQILPVDHKNYSTPTVLSMGGPINGGGGVYWRQAYDDDDIGDMGHNLNFDGDQIETVDHTPQEAYEPTNRMPNSSRQAEMQENVYYNQYDDTNYMDHQNVDFDVPIGEENINPVVDHKVKPRPQKVFKPRNRKPRRKATVPSTYYHQDSNQPSTSGGTPSYSNPVYSNPSKSSDYLDTRRVCSDISFELKMCGISQSKFANRVLKRTQGTLSDTLKKPKPWEDLKEVGKQIYIQMAEWMSLPLDEKMAKVEEEGAELVNEKTDSSENSSDATTKPIKKRFQFSQHQKETLEAIFKIERRPDQRIMAVTAEKLNLDFIQVHTYFMNARRRSRFADDKRVEEMDME